MAPAQTVVARLREATHEAHTRLEIRVDALAQLRSGTTRPGLMARYRLMYSQAADRLAPWFDTSDGSAPSRRGAVPVSSGPGDIQSHAEALGFRYVIEGSALGGRIILRELATLGVDTAGLDFLDPHGARTGEVWRSFMGLLERELSSSPETLEEAVTGALKGFAFAEACLCDPAIAP